MTVPFLFLFLLILLLVFGRKAGDGVRQGLTLAYTAVLPALFPAMVVCGMMGELAESLPLPSALTLWITSHLCGFPLGIRTLARAANRGIISRKQAIGLIPACANASPAFLIGFAGEVILGSAAKGVVLFLGQFLLSGLLLWAGGALKEKRDPLPEEKPLLPLLTGSISAAAIGALTLTAYITLFSVLAALLGNLPHFAFYYGFLELSGGLAALPDTNLKFALAAAMTGFSGLSVFLQNAAYLAEERLPVLPLLWGKLFTGICLPPLVFLLERIFF